MSTIDVPEIELTPSPNFDERYCAIDMVILHYTGMQTGTEALARLCDPAAKVSAHYLIEEDGRVIGLVDENNRAWHAGVAMWKGQDNINARSIGIEIVNPGHEWGYRAFPDVQITSVLGVLKGIVTRWKVAKNRIIGHSDVAPGRKEDPGELFPWDRLAREDLAIGFFPNENDAFETGTGIPYEAALEALSAIGYDAPKGNHAAALLGFQRRFCPQELGQGFSPVTKAALIWAAKEMAD